MISVQEREGGLVCTQDGNGVAESPLQLVFVYNLPSFSDPVDCACLYCQFSVADVVDRPAEVTPARPPQLLKAFDEA